MGNYREGFCFMLIAPIGGKQQENWVLCADDYETKQTWMTQLG